MPQAFCRFAAVHGAQYVLRQPLTGVAVSADGCTSTLAFCLFLSPESDICLNLASFSLRVFCALARVRGVFSEGLLFRASTVVCPPSYVPHLARPRPEAFIARAVVILEGVHPEAVTIDTKSTTTSSAKSKAKTKSGATKGSDSSDGYGPGLFAKGRSLCVLPPRVEGVDNHCSIRVLQLNHTSEQVSELMPPLISQLPLNSRHRTDVAFAHVHGSVHGQNRSRGQRKDSAKPFCSNFPPSWLPRPSQKQTVC